MPKTVLIQGPFPPPASACLAMGDRTCNSHIILANKTITRVPLKMPDPNLYKPQIDSSLNICMPETLGQLVTDTEACCRR